MNLRILLLALLGLGGTPPTFAAADVPLIDAPHVRAELLAEDDGLRPGQRQWMAIRLTPERGWHVYWQNPGDSGLATRIEWTLPDGVAAGDIHWPYPHAESLGDLTNYGYSEATLHLVPLVIPATLSGPQTLSAHVKWLVCSDVCIPGEARLSRTLPVRADAGPVGDLQAAFRAARAALPQPWPGAAPTYEIRGTDFSLHLPEALPADAGLQFFPLANDLVNHAAPQRLDRTADGLRLSQALSAYYVEATPPVEGVLVVAGRGPTQAFALSAAPGIVPPVPDTAEVSSTTTPARPALATVLVFAFLGGLILNLMPCVFPVLSLKALAILRGQDQAAAHRRLHALTYTVGVIVSCLFVAAALLGLRAGGEAIGWGFQLQSPAFVGLLAYLLFALGLSMAGAVEFGSGLMGAGQSLTRSQGLSGSFFTGVLAVVVASPCTAPFMGTALGFALTQPAATALLVFAALGLGLASPFLLIGWVPAAARLLPRPGAWMATFKQLMAFPMFLTAVWLVWVAGRQSGPTAMGGLLVGATLIAFALWLFGRASVLGRVLGVVAIAGALWLLRAPAMTAASAPTAPSALNGAEGYSDARFDALRSEGRTVFVDFTADWCITCKVNERVAIKVARTQAAFAEHNVAVLVGDWTNADPAITAVLERYGRSGVPLYLVSRQGGTPEVLPQILTPDLVINAIAPE